MHALQGSPCQIELVKEKRKKKQGRSKKMFTSGKKRLLPAEKENPALALYQGEQKPSNIVNHKG